MDFAVGQVVCLTFSHYFFFALTTGLAVLAALTNAWAEGAFFEPTLFIFSPEPSAMRFCLALMLE